MDGLQAALAVVLLAVAVGSDVRRRVIPDWAVAGVALLFVLPTLWAGHWREAAAGGAVALLVFLGGSFLFWRGWVGGGDVKLAAALAMWVGPSGMVSFLLLTSLAGGVVSLVCVGWAVVVARWRQVPFHLDRVQVPYGVAIALGGAPFVVAGLTAPGLW